MAILHHNHHDHHHNRASCASCASCGSYACRRKHRKPRKRCRQSRQSNGCARFILPLLGLWMTCTSYRLVGAQDTVVAEMVDMADVADSADSSDLANAVDAGDAGDEEDGVDVADVPVVPVGDEAEFDNGDSSGDVQEVGEVEELNGGQDGVLHEEHADGRVDEGFDGGDAAGLEVLEGFESTTAGMDDDSDDSNEKVSRANDANDAGEASDTIGTSDAEATIEETATATPQPNLHKLDKLDQLNHVRHVPPTHFQIAAHIQTNLYTGISYFLPSYGNHHNSHNKHNKHNETHHSKYPHPHRQHHQHYKHQLSTSFANLPFLECGAVGSTTEGVPLVSGVFRHVPHVPEVPLREIELDLDGMEGMDGVDRVDGMDGVEGMGGTDGDSKEETMGSSGGDASLSKDASENSNQRQQKHQQQQQQQPPPKRPSPPKYIVALTPLEITVGGTLNDAQFMNETQTFQPGDVIFMEDTWWGVWNEESYFHDFNEDGTGDPDDPDGTDETDETSETIDTIETEEAAEDENEQDEQEFSDKQDTVISEDAMKGYIMRAPHDSNTDMHVLMLTVPPSVHRHWKNVQYHYAQYANQFKNQQEGDSFGETEAGSVWGAEGPEGPPVQESCFHSNSKTRNTDLPSSKKPWWKLPTRLLRKEQLQHGSSSIQEDILPPTSFQPAQQHQQYQQYKQYQQYQSFQSRPCSLESDPTYANPSASSTTLRQHMMRHLSSLFRRIFFLPSSLSPTSFLPNLPNLHHLHHLHHLHPNTKEILLPILAQSLAAILGATSALALVLHLSRTVPVPMAVGFGGVSLIGLGTWGVVWLGEEILDEWEVWRERRWLERRLEEVRDG